MTATAIPVTTSQIRSVDLDDITIDLKVQRSEGVDQRRVDKMAAAFNPDALGVLILSHREDGSYVCLDGMHRRAAALKAAWQGRVDARVFTGLSLADEAALFLLYNDKKDPSALSRFLARVIAGDPVAVDINAIANGFGWTIRAYSNSPGYVVAVAALERAYRTGTGTLPNGAHPELLARTLGAITDAWGHDPAGAQDAIIGGVSQLYGRFGDAIDSTKLIREMQDTLPRVLVGKAKTLRDVQGGTVPAALAKILAGMHNSRRRSNLLPEWVWIR